MLLVFNWQQTKIVSLRGRNGCDLRGDEEIPTNVGAISYRRKSHKPGTTAFLSYFFSFLYSVSERLARLAYPLKLSLFIGRASAYWF